MDEELLNAVACELEAGRKVALCLLAEVHGSSPRKPGACLALFKDGRMAGTVGGGALEQIVVRHAATALSRGRGMVERHTLGGAKSTTGMVCGGDVTVATLVIGPAALAAIDALRRAFAGIVPARLAVQVDAEDPAAVVVWTDEGRVVASLAATAAEREALAGVDAPADGPTGAIVMPEAYTDAAAEAAEGLAEPGVVDGWFVLPVLATPRAFIFGGGHVGAALVPVLARLGYPVTVFDDRPEIAASENHPDAARVVCANYEDIVREVAVTSRDIAVISTAGHASDVTVARQLLPCRPRYLGCLGSRKKTAFMHGKLTEAGFSEEEIARLHMPVGLAIGAETPDEIAISIAAEIVAVMHGLELPACWF